MYDLEEVLVSRGVIDDMKLVNLYDKCLKLQVGKDA